MKASYLQLVKESQWFAEQHPMINGVSPDWRDWLLDRGSLTEQLINYSDARFSVKVLSQRWEKPLPHEAQQLRVPMHLAARIREVELYCGEARMVYARSVMPLQVYLEQRHILQNIGTRPLGHLLFKDGKIRISKRRVSRFKDDGQLIYGRSTPYRYVDHEILVSEFFINDALIGKD